MSENLISIIPYATLRMRNVTQLSNEDCANAIADRLQSSNKFMQNDPAAERVRMEMLRALPQCLTVKRSIKSQLLATVSHKMARKPISYWKWLKYNISLKFRKVRMLIFAEAVTSKALMILKIRLNTDSNGSTYSTADVGTMVSSDKSHRKSQRKRYSNVFQVPEMVIIPQHNFLHFEVYTFFIYTKLGVTPKISTLIEKLNFLSALVTHLKLKFSKNYTKTIE